MCEDGKMHIANTKLDDVNVAFKAKAGVYTLDGTYTLNVGNAEEFDKADAEEHCRNSDTDMMCPVSIIGKYSKKRVHVLMLIGHKLDHVVDEAYCICNKLTEMDNSIFICKHDDGIIYESEDYNEAYIFGSDEIDLKNGNKFYSKEEVDKNVRLTLDVEDYYRYVHEYGKMLKGVEDG